MAIIPNSWRLFLHKIIHIKLFSKFKNRTLKDTFNYIYQKNHWAGKESISGKGSDFTQTKKIIQEIPKLLDKYTIKSFLDVPCGDFNWMQQIDLGEIKYIGGDIVDVLIATNQANYKSGSIEFKVINLVEDHLPKSDILMARDCFVHLSYDNILKAINNIKRSNCTYLLATTFSNRTINYDTINGHWRTLNLEIAPFNFPKPLELINENCTEKNGKYHDKSLGLWKITDLP